MIAAIVGFLLVQEDSLAGFLSGKFPVTQSRKVMKQAVTAAMNVDTVALGFGLFRPRNGIGWVVPLNSEAYQDYGVTVYARPVGKTYRLETLFPSGFYLAKSGFFDGAHLIVGGLNGWMGNGPHARAALLRWDGRRWSLQNWVEADFESYECTFRPSGRKWIALIEGRTYPKHIEVPHVMANVGMRQRFIYASGKLVASPAVRTMNPLAVLDDLAGAAARGDTAGVRRGCSSRELAKQVEKLGRKLAGSGWDVPGNMNSTSDRHFIATSLGLRFDFGRVGGQWKLARIVPVRG
ncbi:MAG TPA: hypothetical protein PLH94_10460 [Fimbriimonadaceae bacterium]|nr:hypothetical protein [Fimbriimonadaceae bacterium]